MTSFEIRSLPFNESAIEGWAPADRRHANWPVVYVLDDGTGARVGPSQDPSVYVGETGNAVVRLKQHLSSPVRGRLAQARVVLDARFNKSVCLDLESFLIRMFAGDGSYEVLNRNDGIVDRDYYDRLNYRTTFEEIFEALRRDGLFSKTIPEIENSDLFKLSPFKALTDEQTQAVLAIVEGLLSDLEAGQPRTTVIQGDPGTGKTIVAIYLLKLLVDIAKSDADAAHDEDTVFTDFFQPGYPELLAGLRFGLVIPQQSLRQSVKRVFAKTPGLHAGMILTPYQVAEDPEDYDLLVVDETHRLNQRANQASGPMNKKFKDITVDLFGWDDLSKTQIDWIKKKSRHQIFLLDSAQSVRPADLPPRILEDLVLEAKASESYLTLLSQLRVRGGADYVAYVRSLLDPSVPVHESGIQRQDGFPNYDLQLFDDLDRMRQAIAAQDKTHGLSRLVAGYAWEWKSKRDPAAFDIEIDDVQLRWNSTATDWIASKGSEEEVGSIHTVQGYDLNYAGVIIGPDLRFDTSEHRLTFDRTSYADKKGMENNPTLGKVYSDDDLLRWVTNIYTVLLTRGIRGTYVYVCDPGLRAYLAQYLPKA